MTIYQCDFCGARVFETQIKPPIYRLCSMNDGVFVDHDDFDEHIICDDCLRKLYIKEKSR